MDNVHNFNVRFDDTQRVYGADGTTFTPHVSGDGIISWTNDGGKENPADVCIKGVKGDSVNFRGAHDPTVNYRVCDVVTHIGNAYICIKTGTQGHIPEEEEFFAKLCERGGKGDPFTFEDFTPEQLESLRGPRGNTGTVEAWSKITVVPTAGVNLNCGINTMTVIDVASFTGTAFGAITLMQGAPLYDNEWGITVIQGATAKPITLPSITWGLGIAPTFGADSTTVMRLYYVGEVLCGEWVSV